MIKRFWAFSHRPSFSNQDIDLYLSDELVYDLTCGYTDGYTFSIVDKKTRQYAGYVSLRMGESPQLYYLGHIGYRVEEPFRGHRYAQQACELILPLLRRLGYQSLVITNNVDNWPSRKTCEALGCVLERIVPVPEFCREICMNAPYKCRYIWLIDPDTAKR